MKKLTGTVKTVAPLPVDLPSIINIVVPQVTTQSLVTVLTSMKGEDGTQLVDYSQATALTSLKLQDGEDLLSLEYRPFVYEVVNLLNSLDYEIVYNFLAIDWEKLFGSHNIRDKIIFDNPLLQNERDKMEVDMEIYRGNIDVTQGAVDCERCGSSETLSVEKQSRSGDEMVSVKSTCLQCKFKWTVQ